MVCMVKTMAFPLVMYGCVRLTIKKAECQRIDALELWLVLKKTLENPLDSKEIKLVNPKGINSEYSLEGLMLKLKFQYFGHLMGQHIGKDPNTGKGRMRRVQQRMRWLDDILESVDMGLSKLQDVDMDREAWHATVHGGHKKSDTAEQLNNK